MRPSGDGGGSGFGVGGDDWDCAQRELASSPPPDLTSECVSCLCDMRLKATQACTLSCFQLLMCFAKSGCDSTDTACIRGTCVEALGGMEKYMAAASLAVAVPFQQCAPCAELIEDPETDASF